MRQIFQRLYHHGTSGSSEAQRARVQIGNLVAALGCVVTVLFAFAHLALGHVEAAAVNLAVGVAYTAYFPLQSRGLRSIGSVFIATMFLLHLAALTLLFGLKGGFQIYFVLGAPVALVLFSTQQWRSRSVMVAASLLLYVGFELADAPPLFVMNQGWGGRLLMISSVPSIAILLLLIHGVYLAEIHKRQVSLEYAAHTDALTGLPNRRHGFDHAAVAFARARRSGEAMAVLVLDLDHFKLVNDRYGHAAGDALLVRVAQALTERLRQQDMVARWGGEEFLIVVSTSASGDAHDVAHALRERIGSLDFRHEGDSLRCTASVGVALMSPQDGTLEALLGRADRALYEAKARGRDRVVIDACSVGLAADAAQPRAVNPVRLVRQPGSLET